jgi:hypothetical protein
MGVFLCRRQSCAVPPSALLVSKHKGDPRRSCTTQEDEEASNNDPSSSLGRRQLTLKQKLQGEEVTKYFPIRVSIYIEAQ